MCRRFLRNSVTWLCNDVAFNETDVPKEAIGFVYKIVNLKTGKVYIGKKLLFFSKTSQKTVLLKNGTKKKKKIKSLVPSDWKTYWGSSEKVLKDIEEYGVENFSREILFFCENKGSMGYWEAQLQMDLRVLEHQDKYYNGIVSCRVHSSHVRPKIIL